MKMVRRKLLAVWFVFLVSLAPLAAGEAGSKADTVYQKTLRATAMVLTPQGQGSGWVVSRDKRQLITSQHVVRGSDKVLVVFPAYRHGRVIAGREFYKDNAEPVLGRVVRTDVGHDLALIEVAVLPANVGELALATEAPSPGDSVHAVGCPGQSTGLWVYSYGKVRSVTEAEWTDGASAARAARVIESSIPVNSGDSGGPLVNDRGEVVGVNQGIHPKAQLLSVSVEVGEVKAFLADDIDFEALGKAAAHFRAAQRFMGLKQWDKAKSSLLEGLKIEPRHLEGLTDLAYVLIEQKDYDGAISKCLRALEINEDYAPAWREAGYAFFKKGELKDASDGLVIAVRLNPKDRSAWNYLAEVRKALGDEEGAAWARRKAKALELPGLK